MEYSYNVDLPDQLLPVINFSFPLLNGINTDSLAIKPFPVEGVSISGKDMILTYRATLSQAFKNNLIGYLYQKLDDSEFCFLANLYAGTNLKRLEFSPLAQPINLVVVIRPWIRELSLAMEFSGDAAVTSSSGLTLEYEISDPAITEFPIPNIGNLNEDLTQVTLNGVTQDDVTDYFFSSTGLTWVSPVALLPGFKIIIKAMYT